MAASVGVFVVAAGAGAFVASRSDPFPPDVDGTVATPGASPTLSTDHWMLRTTTNSAHILHVGGTCRGRWLLRAARRDARRHGDGERDREARRSGDMPLRDLAGGGAPYFLRTTSRATSATLFHLVLVFRPSHHGTDPAGSSDLAGYAAALSVMTLPVHGTSARATLTTSVPDGYEDPPGSVRTLCAGGVPVVLAVGSGLVPPAPS